MRIINTSKIHPKELSAFDKSQVYNGLDCCVTYEVNDVLMEKLGKYTADTYAFSRALQGPVLDMRIRGIKVDLKRKEEVVEMYFNTIDQMEMRLERIVREGCDFIGFKWGSTHCLQKLFYDIFRIPPILTKEGKPTCDRAALEKLNMYTIAQPIIQYILEMRDMKRRLDVVKTGIDDDGRIRTSYNIAGTDTGRFSSSMSEYGTGGNLQNISEFHRSMFIADDGMKMANFDAEQGESRCVGAITWNLFHSGAYLDACESGDLHTVVSRMCEPSWPWTGDMIKDRVLAETPYYRHHDLRKLCKSIGHGTNYRGGPETLNHLYKIPINLITTFQGKYFKAFPGQPRWHAWVEEQIRTNGKLVSLTGRLRHFFGRRDDDNVIRAAIAFDPQCSLSDIVNHGMLQVWRENNCQLLLQNHDSILVQYPQEKEDEVIPKILTALQYPIRLKHDRTLLMPYGCKTGWNWGEFDSEQNPDGLRSYKPGDKRSRAATLPKLDRKLR